MIEIRSLLSGEMDMHTFIHKVKSDPVTQENLRLLVPKDAVDNATHPFWKNNAFASLKNNGFDFIQFLSWKNKFDCSMGDNLSLFSSIQRAYLFHDPDLKCTTIYYDMFELMLDVVKDCFDGPEVAQLLEEVIKEALVHKTKKQRIASAKLAINSLFHVEGTKRPRWIQGPEWPMGKHSPMEYIETKRCGEQVHYFFRDVDTSEVRDVVQWY